MAKNSGTTKLSVGQLLLNSEPLYQEYHTRNSLCERKNSKRLSPLFISSENYLEYLTTEELSDGEDNIYETIEALSRKSANIPHSSDDLLSHPYVEVEEVYETSRENIPPEFAHSTLWQDLSVVKESGIINNLSKTDLELQEAMFEVISSEASYLSTLMVFRDVFLNSQNFSIILEKKKKSFLKGTLFSNIPKLIESSEKFYQQLIKYFVSRQFEDYLIDDICEIILNFVTEGRLENFVFAVQNVKYQLQTLKEIKNNSEIKQVIDTLEKDSRCCSLSLESFILAPFQRVTRYPLLISQILKCRKKVLSKQLNVDVDTMLSISERVKQLRRASSDQGADNNTQKQGDVNISSENLMVTRKSCDVDFGDGLIQRKQSIKNDSSRLHLKDVALKAHIACTELVKRCQNAALIQDRQETMLRVADQLIFDGVKTFPLAAASRYLVKHGMVSQMFHPVAFSPTTAKPPRRNKRKNIAKEHFSSSAHSSINIDSNPMISLNQQFYESNRDSSTDSSFTLEPDVTYQVIDYCPRKFIYAQKLIGEDLDYFSIHSTKVSFSQSSTLPVDAGASGSILSTSSCSKYYFLLTLLDSIHFHGQHDEVFGANPYEYVLCTSLESDRQRWITSCMPKEPLITDDVKIYETWNAPECEITQDFLSTQTDELSLVTGDIVKITRKYESEGWYYGEILSKSKHHDSNVGWFPKIICKTHPSAHSAAKIAKDGYHVFQKMCIFNKRSSRSNRTIRHFDGTVKSRKSFNCM